LKQLHFQVNIMLQYKVILCYSKL